MKFPFTAPLVEVKPGMKFNQAVLNQILPDVETLLFFAKVYELTPGELGNLLNVRFGNSSVVDALVGHGGEHSTELQDYILELGYEWLVQTGEVTFTPRVPKGEILPDLWKSLEIEVAQSIKDVAAKLKDVVAHMPGKQGEMVFKSMAVLNAKRPIIGDHKAHIHHAPQLENLVILDVSGSMTEDTVRTIIEDVIALSYMANAHLAIVSNNTTRWKPGEYDADSVLAVAEFGGTHYETLAPLFDQDWGTVVTIADYDSSYNAASAFRTCRGQVEQLLDISLVSRPTFLAEVVGQVAKEMRPLLVASTDSSVMYGR